MSEWLEVSVARTTESWGYDEPGHVKWTQALKGFL